MRPCPPFDLTMMIHGIRFLTRRQIAFQNLVIALTEDGNLDPVIVLSCKYVENETSVRCLQSIIETVSNMSHNSGVWSILIYIFACLFIYNLTNIFFVSFATLQLDKLKPCLTCWRDITKREFFSRPDLLDMIPQPDSINIYKLGEGGTITTNTCNTG